MPNPHNPSPDADFVEDDFFSSARTIEKTEDAPEPDEIDITEELPADEPEPEPEVAPKAKQKQQPKKKAEPKVPEKDPKEDTSRMEYWQSRHDKLKEELEAVKPLADFFKARPDLLENIGKQLAEEKNPTPKVVKPEPPARPSAYNEVEAYTDPESESFKYRLAEDKYRAQLVDYFEKRDEIRTAEMEHERTARKVQEQRAEAMAKVRAAAQARGIVGDRFNHLLQVMDSPESVTLDNVLDLYLLKYPAQEGKKEIKSDKTADLLKRKTEQSIPPPVGVAGGESEAPEEEMSDEDLFNASLARYRRNLKKAQ